MLWFPVSLTTPAVPYQNPFVLRTWDVRDGDPQTTVGTVQGVKVKVNGKMPASSPSSPCGPASAWQHGWTLEQWNAGLSDCSCGPTVLYQEGQGGALAGGAAEIIAVFLALGGARGDGAVNNVPPAYVGQGGAKAAGVGKVGFVVAGQGGAVAAGQGKEGLALAGQGGAKADGVVTWSTVVYSGSGGAKGDGRGRQTGPALFVGVGGGLADGSASADMYVFYAIGQGGALADGTPQP